MRSGSRKHPVLSNYRIYMQSSILFYQFCPSVCLSVCTSNAGFVSKGMDISSHVMKNIIILIFEHHPRRYKILMGTPMGALNTWGGKFATFDRNRCYFGNGTRQVPCYRPLIGSQKYIVARSVSVPMTLSDLESRDTWRQIFAADLCCSARIPLV